MKIILTSNSKSTNQVTLQTDGKQEFKSKKENTSPLSQDILLAATVGSSKYLSRKAIAFPCPPEVKSDFSPMVAVELGVAHLLGATGSSGD
jgi:hypothetical protein